MLRFLVKSNILCFSIKTAQKVAIFDYIEADVMPVLKTIKLL